MYMFDNDIYFEFREREYCSALTSPSLGKLEYFMSENQVIVFFLKIVPKNA